MRKNKLLLLLVALCACISMGAQTILPRYLAAMPVVDAPQARTGGLAAAPVNAVPSAVATADGTPRAASSADVTLMGCMIYSSLWSSNSDGEYGIYSFPATAQTAFAPVSVSKDYNLVGAAALDGMFCGYKVQTFAGSLLTSTYYMFDADTWTLVEKKSLARAFSNYATSALAFNPVDRTLYGQFMTADGQGLCISTVDVTTGQPTQISTIPGDKMFLTFSFDKKGVLYAIADDGCLYTVEPTTGESKLIGSTGITGLQYSQSATIDAATGRMFWSMMDSSKRSALYEVSLQTGQATLVSEYGATVEVVGMHTAAPFCDAAAPAAVTDLKVAYDEPGGTEATVSFKAPAVAIDGTPLTGALDVEVAYDYVPGYARTAAVQPGAEYSLKVQMPAGHHKVEVKVGNAAGLGLRAWTATYAGYDLPAAVTGLTFTLDGQKAKLSWTAPATGLNGGYFSPDDLYYKVYRYPGNVLVADELRATSFEETLPEDMGKYYYRVVSCTTEDGGSAVSDAIECGSAMTIPYVEDFSDASSLDLYTCIDANGDNKNWKWAENAAVSEDRYGNDAADNWLITPPLALSADWIYKLSFKTKAYGSYYVERLETAFGSGTTVSDMTTPLGTYTVNGEKYVEHSSLLEVKADGNYNVGFHHASSGYGTFQSLYIGEVKVEKYIPTTAPDGVTALDVKAGNQGSLKADVSFKAPVKSINGTPLTAIDHISVLVNDSEVKRFDAPTPGADYSLTVNLANGNNVVSVVAYDAEYPGRTVSADVWGGVDVPGYVRNLKAVWNADDDMSTDITWDAPDKGLNGGYLNPDALTYNYLVYGSFIGYYDSKTGITDRHYTATSTLLTGQTYYYGAIRAVSSAGSSTVYVPFGITLGKPLTAFSESFAGGSTATSYWSVGHLSDVVTWSMANDGTIQSHDGDNGYAFSSGAEGAGESRLETPIISLESNASPALEFWLYRTAGNTSTLTVEASTDGAEFKPVSAVITTDGTTGWTRCEVPLSALAGAKRVQLAFHSNVAEGEFVAIDAVNLITSTTGIDGVSGTDGDILVSGNTAVLTGMAGNELKVVSADGRIIMQHAVASDHETVQLTHSGVCFVICGGKVVKVLVR